MIFFVRVRRRGDKTHLTTIHLHTHVHAPRHRAPADLRGAPDGRRGDGHVLGLGGGGGVPRVGGTVPAGVGRHP